MTTTLSLITLEISMLVDPLMNTDMSSADAQVLFDSEVKRQVPQARSMMTTSIPFRVGLCEASISNTDLSIRVLSEFIRRGVDTDVIYDHDFGAYVESKTLLHCALVHGCPEFVGALLKAGSDPQKKQITSMWGATLSGRVKNPISHKNGLDLIADRENDSSDSKAHKLRMRTILQSWNSRNQAHRILDEIGKNPSP